MTGEGVVGEYLVARRFWVAQGTEYAVSDGGFLSDPDQELGSAMNQGLATLESIRTQNCAVLLGESGMGKSTALDLTYGTEARSSSGNVTTRRIDLGFVDSSQSLHDALTENDAPLAADGILELVFDSLDLCPMNYAVDAIAHELGKNKAVLPHLRLRIACHSSYWPPHADETLARLFGSKNAVYELCPLRRVDVERIAETQLEDSEAFVRDVCRRGLVPLAGRPVTLGFLLQEYQDGAASFGATSPVQLYDRGMDKLAGTDNPRRNEGPLGTPVGVDVRRAVAERLGALSALTGRRRLRLRPRQLPSETDQGVLSYEDAIASLSRGIDLHGFEPDVAFRATLDCTAFFAASIPGCVTWAHGSYADFLAASYLVRRGVNSTKTLELLLVANTQGKIVGQLRPLAEWLTAMSDEFRGILIRENPALVMEKDSAPLLSEAKKRELIRALLEQHSKPDVLYVDPALTDKLAGLEYPGICEQLRGYLTDADLPLPTRELAVLCVREMRLRDLGDSCLQIALDTAEQDSLRESAVEAAAVSGTPETRQRLRPLIVPSERLGHESQDVYAAAAKVLWKESLTTQELFDSLPLPRESMLGQYEYFLDFTLGPSLAEADLPYALGWVSRLNEAWLDSYGTHSLVDTIVLKAWQMASSAPGEFPLEQFAAAYWNLASKRDSAFLEHHGLADHEVLLQGPVEARSQVALLVLSGSGYADNAPFVVALCSTPLLDASDFEWVLDIVRASESQDERRALAELAWYIFRRDSLSHILVLLDHDETAEIHDRFKELIDPVRVDSDEATRMRADYESAQKFESRRADEETRRRQREAKLPTSGTIRQLAAAILSDSGKPTFQRWYSFYVAVSAASSQRFPYNRPLDMVQLSAWGSLDTNTKNAALKCALAYLHDVEPVVEKAVASDTWTYGTIYGLPCIVLVARQYGLSALSDALIDRWLPALLAYPVGWEETESKRVAEICMSLATRCPRAIVQTARLILENYALSQNPSEGVLQRLEIVWSDDVCQLVLDALRNPGVGMSLLSWCIRALCAKGVPQVRAISLDMVRAALQEGSTPETTDKAAVAALSLAQACPDWWDLLWESLSQNASLGKGFVQRMSSSHHGLTPSAVEGLSEDQIATFYSWIVDSFPEISKPMELGAHWMSPVEQVQDLANALLIRLQKGTGFASVEALRRIRDHYPERPWLRRVVAECEDKYYVMTWSPPSVDELTVLLDEPSTRYVNDERELLHVLEEQLQVLQQRLRGETPAYWELWNEWKQVGKKQVGKTLWRPKEETRVSDWVKEALELALARGHVVINREVEIRRSAGPKAPGQNTDIHVVATREAAPNVEVIIEVKGCWSESLLTDMKDQLAHRYLADNACYTGIYLVAWFNWTGWDGGDSRRRGVAFRHSRAQLEELLSRQAEEVSAEGYAVVSRLLDFTPPNAEHEGA